MRPCQGRRCGAPGLLFLVGSAPWSSRGRVAGGRCSIRLSERDPGRAIIMARRCGASRRRSLHAARCTLHAPPPSPAAASQPRQQPGPPGQMDRLRRPRDCAPRQMACVCRVEYMATVHANLPRVQPVAVHTYVCMCVCMYYKSA